MVESRLHRRSPFDIREGPADAAAIDANDL
jgi:hypothetical protein